MKLVTTIVPIAAVLTTTMSGGVADAAPAIKPIAAGRCEFNFHQGAPYLKEPAAMVAGGYVDCKIAGTPDVFSTVLRLKFKPKGGDWSTRAIEPSEQVPAPILNIATWASCEPGAWVATVEMWDTRANTTTHYGDESAPIITSC